MTVGRSLKAPLYHQIYLILRQKVLNGDDADGALLPGALAGIGAARCAKVKTLG